MIQLQLVIIQLSIPIGRLTQLSLARSMVTIQKWFFDSLQWIVIFLVSSFIIKNYRVTEERNHSSLVTCSVSIVRSTFKEADLSASSISSNTKSTGTENMPRLNLFLSTRISSSLSPLSDDKITNDTFVGQTLIRSIAMRQSLTRADHNGTIQCQVESTNNLDVYLTKTEFVDIYCEYFPRQTTYITEMFLLFRWTKFRDRRIE